MSAGERFRMLCAVHVLLFRGGETLLLRRANTGYQDGNFSTIAGHLDGGEEVLAAAVREAREEAGITLDPADLRVVEVMHNRGDDAEYIDFFVAAARWEGVIVNAEPHKCAELTWHPLDRLPPNTIPYVRRALENYQRGIWFDSFGWDAGERRP